MATELLATGTTAASSLDITVTDTAFVFLKDADGHYIDHEAVVWVEIKDSAGNYTTIGQLTQEQQGVVISHPGTYRVRRKAGTSCGVEQA